MVFAALGSVEIILSSMEKFGCGRHGFLIVCRGQPVAIERAERRDDGLGLAAKRSNIAGSISRKPSASTRFFRSQKTFHELYEEKGLERSNRMARGSKAKYTNKQKRKAEHIEEGYEKRGTSKKEAERRAWATVNKESGGGKKSGSGRGKKSNKSSSRKGGRKGGKKSHKRSKKKS